jgi:hypothetical protein
MKRELLYTIYLSLWIVLLCSFGMLMTFVSDYLQSSGFFGDIEVAPNYRDIDPGWEWGARHYWYFWMCFFLVMTSVARIITWSITYFIPQDNE